MADIERSWLTNPSRRNALVRVAGLMAASPVAAAVAQSDPRPLSEHHRVLSLAEMQTTFDFEPVFFGNVIRSIYDCTAHGDGSEFTLRRNRQAYDWVDIMPARSPVPASQVDLSSDLLGVKMKFPIIVAPTAGMVPLHPDGEIGMFKAATAASNTLMMLSINTSTPAAKVAPAVPGGTLWGSFTRWKNWTRPSDRWTPTRLPASTTSSSPSISRRPTTNARSRTVISVGASLPRAAVAKAQEEPVQEGAGAEQQQRPPARHGTGSTASAFGTPGNISTTCGKWSKARC